MVSLNNLPPNILANIFERLGRRDCSEYRLTCKRLLRLCRPLLDVTKRINSPGQLCFLEKRLLKNPNAGRYVVAVDANCVFSEDDQEVNWDPMNCFNFFLKYYRNLRSISAYKPGIHFRLALEKAIEKGYWRKMNDLHLPENADHNRVYVRTAWMMRDRLTNLYICDDIECEYEDDYMVDEPQFRDSYQMLANNIASFPQVHTLRFVLHEYQPLFDFDKYIDDCVQLQNLSIVTQLPLLPSFDPNILCACRMQRNGKKSSPSVKQLLLKIVISNDDVLIYIMCKFPALLQFTFNCADAENQVNHYLSAGLSPITSGAFLRYLLKIPQLDIHKLYLKGILGLLCERNFLSNLNRDIYLKVIYTGTTNSCQLHPALGIASAGPKSPLSLTLDFKINNNVSFLPHLVVTEIIGHLFKRVQLSMPSPNTWGRYRNTLNLKQQLPTRCYSSYIIEDCPKVEQIALSSAKLTVCDPNVPINYSVTQLIFNDCEIDLADLPDILARFVSLQQLHLISCNYLLNKGISGASCFVLDMPSQSLKKLLWYFSERSYHELSLQVTNTHTGSNTFFMADLQKQSGFLNNEQTPEDHEQSRDNDKILTIDIRCASIEEFTLKTNVYYAQYTNIISYRFGLSA